MEQLAQHFDRPLTKGKAEAIDVLANHAKQGTKKKKRQSGGTVAPAPRPRPKGGAARAAAQGPQNSGAQKFLVAH